MNYIKSIRQFLKDPKKRSLTLLGIYALFFIFVFIVLSGSNDSHAVTSVEKEKTTFENYKEMTSYDYTITYTNIDKVDIISGEYVNNTSLFTFNNNTYYYDSKYYLIDNDSYYETSIEYNVSKLFNTNLYSIFENLDSEYKTTYKDGKIQTSYNIDRNEYNLYYYNINTQYSDYINIKITELDKFIQKIEIQIDDNSSIVVEYSNINNIEDLNLNKDNLNFKEMNYD